MAGTSGTLGAQHWRGGSPENDPRLRKRAFREGRSSELSLQEGGTAQMGCGGVRHRHSCCHVPLSGCVVRVEVQCPVGRDFDCGDSLRFRLRCTCWDQPRRTHALSGPTLLVGRTGGAPRAIPSMSDNPTLTGLE